MFNQYCSFCFGGGHGFGNAFGSLCSSSSLSLALALFLMRLPMATKLNEVHICIIGEIRTSICSVSYKVTIISYSIEGTFFFAPVWQIQHSATQTMKMPSFLLYVDQILE